jgi:hypothetical protein
VTNRGTGLKKKQKCANHPISSETFEPEPFGVPPLGAELSAKQVG